ncbi:MAG: sugar ABC transporter substrate-binding protein [Caldilineaceae bacterium]|nr:sugar ABC transporter substrate-binding protein [Caldilineaceae bacterium]
MANRMNRRDFLSLSVATAGGGLLAACVAPAAAPEDSGASMAEEPIEIRLAEGSWVGPEGIAFWTDEIIPSFEEGNPGINVTFENAESPDYADKLYTQAVAGDSPDVMFVWDNINYNLLQKGQLLQLDDYFESEYLEDFYPALVNAHLLDGQLFGMPKYVSTVVMAYNKDLLDEAGVNHPDGSWNWDDYLAAYEATTKRDDSGNIVQWGNYVAQGYIQHYVWMNGGEWMNTEIFGTKCLLDSEEAVEALKFNHSQIYGDNPVAPIAGSIPEVGWWNVFSTGKVAFMESHSWTVTNYIRENDFAWDFIDLPVARDGTKAGLTFCNGYVIAKKTKEPDASVQLVRFLTSPQAEEVMALSIVGLQPARRSVAGDAWDVRSMGAEAGYDVAAFSRIMEHTRLNPAFQENDKVNSEAFGPIWDQIWVTGEIGLEEGVNLIVERIDEIFA